MRQHVHEAAVGFRNLMRLVFLDFATEAAGDFGTSKAAVEPFFYTNDPQTAAEWNEARQQVTAAKSDRIEGLRVMNPSPPTVAVALIESTVDQRKVRFEQAPAVATAEPESLAAAWSRRMSSNGTVTEIQVGHIKQMVRIFGIEDCAATLLPQLRIKPKASQARRRPFTAAHAEPRNRAGNSSARGRPPPSVPTDAASALDTRSAGGGKRRSRGWQAEVTGVATQVTEGANELAGGATELTGVANEGHGGGKRCSRGWQTMFARGQTM